MKKLEDFFDLSTLEEEQKQALTQLLDSARRAQKLRQPRAYSRNLHQACIYYLGHSSRDALPQAQREAAAERMLDDFPSVKGRDKVTLTIWKGALMILLGIGAAFTFLYLYFNRESLDISPVLLFIGLIVFTILLILLPFVFSKRKEYRP